MAVLTDKTIAAAIRKFSHEKNPDQLRSPSQIAEQEVLEYLTTELAELLEKRGEGRFDKGRFYSTALGYREV